MGDTEQTPNRLKLLRTQGPLNLTLQEVSMITGYNISTISRHESGELGLSPQAIVAYAKLYKVETYEIFFVRPASEKENA